MREVRYLGDPVLREMCREVETIDDDIRALVDDLLETMYAEDGIGLAAPQIGVPLRVFVYDVREDEIAPGVLVNPRIVEATGKQKEIEGCLSIPGLRGWVERPASIQVKAWDEQGKPIELTLEGYPAVVVQHECDHLDGVLYVDRIEDMTTFGFELEAERFLDPAGNANEDEDDTHE